MNILYMHASKIQMAVEPVGRDPSAQRKRERRLQKRLGLELPRIDETNRLTEGENALVALVFVEKQDNKLNLNRIKRDIVEAAARIGVSNIIISAFAHLGNDPATAIIAREVIESAAGKIKEVTGLVTSVVPFGWDKTFEISVPCHPYNAAFRSFKPTAREQAAYYINWLFS